MTTITPTSTSSLHSVAVVLSSLVIALPLLVSKLIEVGLDSVNPADVDVSQDLAYLRELLGFSVGFLGLLLLIIAALVVQIFRQENRFSAISLPVTIVVVQVVVGIALLVMTGVADRIEDAYLAGLS